MTRITSFDQLELNGIYTLTSDNFKTPNEVKLISFDNHDWGRKICYFQYTKRGQKILTAEEFKSNMEKDIYIPGIIAFWDHDFQFNTLEKKD